MNSTVYFRVGESKFRLGAAHPAYPIDESLDPYLSKINSKSDRYAHLLGFAKIPILLIRVCVSERCSRIYVIYHKKIKYQIH